MLTASVGIQAQHKVGRGGEEGEARMRPMATPRPIPAKAFSTKPLPLLATLLSRFLRVLLRTTQPFTLCIRFCCWHPGLHGEEWLVPQQVRVNPQLPKSPWYLGSCPKSVWVGWERCSNPEPAVGVGSPSEGRAGSEEGAWRQKQLQRGQEWEGLGWPLLSAASTASCGSGGWVGSQQGRPEPGYSTQHPFTQPDPRNPHCTALPSQGEEWAFC